MGRSGGVLAGWNYTGCAHDATCRYTQERYENNIRRCDAGTDFDWKYPSIIEAFGGGGVNGNDDGSVDGNNETTTITNITISNERKRTVFTEQFADVNYMFYNRGLWGKIPKEKAERMMTLFHDFTTPPHADGNGGDEAEVPNNNRCFFKSTTGCGRSHADGHYEYEYDAVRPATFFAGCEYMDVGHLTQEFSLLLFSHPPPPRNVMSEYGTVFWDAVHYQPWVYEELNNLLLNVLCNV